MSDRLFVGLAAVAGAMIGTLTSAYYAFFSAPAAVSARPELAELPFWTALFSGRFTEWAFYTHTGYASAATIALSALCVVFAGVLLAYD